MPNLVEVPMLFMLYVVKLLKVLCATFKNCPRFYAQRCGSTCCVVRYIVKVPKVLCAAFNKCPKFPWFYTQTFKSILKFYAQCCGSTHSFMSHGLKMFKFFALLFKVSRLFGAERQLTSVKKRNSEYFMG